MFVLDSVSLSETAVAASTEASQDRPGGDPRRAATSPELHFNVDTSFNLITSIRHNPDYFRLIPSRLSLVVFT